MPCLQPLLLLKTVKDVFAIALGAHWYVNLGCRIGLGFRQLYPGPGLAISAPAAHAARRKAPDFLHPAPLPHLYLFPFFTPPAAVFPEATARRGRGPCRRPDLPAAAEIGRPEIPGPPRFRVPQRPPSCFILRIAAPHLHPRLRSYSEALPDAQRGLPGPHRSRRGRRRRRRPTGKRSVSKTLRPPLLIHLRLAAAPHLHPRLRSYPDPAPRRTVRAPSHAARTSPQPPPPPPPPPPPAGKRSVSKTRETAPPLPHPFHRHPRPLRATVSSPRASALPTARPRAPGTASTYAVPPGAVQSSPAFLHTYFSATRVGGGAY